MSRQIAIAGDPATVYDLLADLGRWPRLLPHVRAVHGAETHRTDGRESVDITYERFGIPTRCTCLMAREPAEWRLGLLHVRGHAAGIVERWEVRATADGDAELQYACSTLGDSLITRVAARALVNPLALRTMEMVDLLATSDRLARARAIEPPG
jgi:hypothetical protein